MDLWIKGMVYKEVGDHIYDVDVASEHDIQQRAVFLIFPILALVIGQFTYEKLLK